MRRTKNHIVCQHLERISRRALEAHQDTLKELVRQRHGIYSLYRKGKLCYVGLAKNLRSRLTHHLRDRHANTWDSFSMYLAINAEHIRELEALVIRIAMPKENRQKGKFFRSQDLSFILRRALKEKMKQDLHDLFVGTIHVGSKTKTKAKPVKGRPKLAGYIKKGLNLQFRYKGKLHWAYLRKDGMIRHKKKLFKSPSAAAFAITKHGVDGWHAWLYQRAPGDWIKLDELRK